MKYYSAVVLLVCAILHFAQSRTLPDSLKQYVCRASDPQYESCVLGSFERARPLFVQGIPELNMPPIDPFELPYMAVNRSLNELVSINALCKNIRMVGGSQFVIDSLKADPIKHYGEMRVTLPWVHLEMDYDVAGQLLVVPLQSRGFFEGNFTDTQIFVRGSLKKYKKDGEEYFRVQKISSKIRVGDGHIKLTAKNPELQFGANLIAAFYNENPRRVMDAVNPIFVETSNELFRVVADQILAALPASEWLPE